MAQDGTPRFEEYLAARERALLRTAWLLTGDRQRAEDLLQTALVRVWPRWDRICSGGDPDGYVRTVLVRTYATDRRRRWHGELPTDAVPDGAAPDAYEAADLRDALRRVLPALGPRQRAVLVLRFHEDLTETQTAQALGISVGTVKSQASRALAALRTALGSRERLEVGDE